MKYSILVCLFLIGLISCDKHIDSDNEQNQDGLKPIYISRAEYDKIYVSDPIPLKEPGKIYKYKQYIFINEKYRGVHVVDNSDPFNPVKLKFIFIPGNKDVAMKNGILYADNFTDVVALDLSDLSDVKVTKRIKNIIPKENQLYPEFASNTYFECVDTTKGYVIGWESVQLSNPKCYKE